MDKKINLRGLFATNQKNNVVLSAWPNFVNIGVGNFTSVPIHDVWPYGCKQSGSGYLGLNWVGVLADLLKCKNSKRLSTATKIIERLDNEI